MVSCVCGTGPGCPVSPKPPCVCPKQTMPVGTSMAVTSSDGPYPCTWHASHVLISEAGLLTPLTLFSKLPAIHLDNDVWKCFWNHCGVWVPYVSRLWNTWFGHFGYSHTVPRWWVAVNYVSITPDSDQTHCFAVSYVAKSSMGWASHSNLCVVIQTTGLWFFALSVGYFSDLQDGKSLLRP